MKDTKKMMGKIIGIANPLVIMFEHGEERDIVCHLHPAEGWNYQSYGILVCDLVRNIAKAFDVDEDDVWEWVDKERENHTSELKTPS